MKNLSIVTMVLLAFFAAVYAASKTYISAGLIPKSGQAVSSTHITAGLIPNGSAPSCDSCVQNVARAVDTSATKFWAACSTICDSGTLYICHGTTKFDSSTVKTGVLDTLMVSGLTPNTVDSVRFIFESDTSTNKDTTAWLLFATDDTTYQLTISLTGNCSGGADPDTSPYEADGLYSHGTEVTLTIDVSAECHITPTATYPSSPLVFTIVRDTTIIIQSDSTVVTPCDSNLKYLSITRKCDAAISACSLMCGGTSKLIMRWVLDAADTLGGTIYRDSVVDKEAPYLYTDTAAIDPSTVFWLSFARDSSGYTDSTAWVKDSTLDSSSDTSEWVFSTYTIDTTIHIVSGGGVAYVQPAQFKFAPGTKCTTFVDPDVGSQCDSISYTGSVTGHDVTTADTAILTMSENWTVDYYVSATGECTNPTISYGAIPTCSLGVVFSLDPEHTGDADSAAISPVVSPGLTFTKTGGDIGKISGTPTTIDTSTQYIITIYGCSGNSAKDTIAYDVIKNPCVVPAVEIADPEAGHRVWQQLSEYVGHDSVRHALYLPPSYNEGTDWPVIIELPAQPQNAVDGATAAYYAIMGYGLSKGDSAIWVNVPFLTTSGENICYSYWQGCTGGAGSPTQTITYVKRLRDYLKSTYSVDTTDFTLCGFSRGSVGSAIVGLADDTIAGYWRSMVMSSFGDTIYVQPNGTRISRIKQFGIRMLLTAGATGDGFKNTVDSYENNLIDSGVTYTRYDIPSFGHDIRWITTCGNTYRDSAAMWLTDITVAYDANGGNGTMTDPSSPYGWHDSVTVLTNTFTRSGYTFSSFNTAANGSGTSRAPGSKFQATANVTLYAQWTRSNAYYVRSDGTVTAANKENAVSYESEETSLSEAEAAAATFSAGDSVLFSSSGGDYTESFTIPSGGSVGSRIVYGNVAGQTPTLTGSAGAGIYINVNGKSNVTVNGFYILYTGTGASATGLLCNTTCSNVTISNCVINMGGYGYAYQLGANNLSNISLINDSAANGASASPQYYVYGTGNSSLSFSKCKTYSPGGYGFYVAGTTGLTIDSCRVGTGTISHNGIHVATSAGTILLTNNIVNVSGAYSIRTLNCTGTITMSGNSILGSYNTIGINFSGCTGGVTMSNNQITTTAGLGIGIQSNNCVLTDNKMQTGNNAYGCQIYPNYYGTVFTRDTFYTSASGTFYPAFLSYSDSSTSYTDCIGTGFYAAINARNISYTRCNSGSASKVCRGIGFNVTNTAHAIAYANCRASYCASLGFASQDSSYNINRRYCRSDNNGTLNDPTNGSGSIPHTYVTGDTSWYCVADSNYNSGFGDVSTRANAVFNCLCWNNGIAVGDSWHGGTATTGSARGNLYFSNIASGTIFQNNISGGPKAKPREIRWIGTLCDGFDYNLYWPLDSSKFISYDGSTDTTWYGYHVTQNREAHSSKGNPIFTSASTADYSLTYLSPAIDAGTVISGVTVDYLGNPIYGTPDMGPYEYQPSYTVGTHEIDIGGGARIYANGKFRTLTAASSSTIDLAVYPDSGSFGTFGATATRPFWGDITNIINDDTISWNMSTSGSSSDSVYYIIAGSGLYRIGLVQSGDTATILKSASTGNLTFNGPGGTSSVYLYTVNASITSTIRGSWKSFRRFLGFRW